MKKYLYLFITALLAVTTLSLTSCSKDDDDLNTKTDYDVIQVNGENYACYGYRCAITYSSSWDLSSHSGQINLPCGKLSDAKKGEYDIDELFSISLMGNQDLKKGSKLEDFATNYVSGSATITDKKADKYIIVKFDSFKFKDYGGTYTINGTAQLDLDED